MSNTDERTRLMKIKKRMSQKRPKFTKFESWRLIRLKDHWRKPKGIDNKMRQNRKGWPRSVSIGYGSPKTVKHFHPSGLEEVMIYNVGDLAIVDPENQVARVGGSVGRRKRRAIIREAENLGIRVLNPGNILPDKEKEVESLQGEARESLDDLVENNKEDKEE